MGRFFLVALVLLAALGQWIRSVLAMPATNFGSVQVGDGYATPQTIQPGCLVQLQYSVTNNIATGINKVLMIMPYAGTVVDVRGAVATAPTGATIIVDVMKNGVTMFTTAANRPTIAINGTTSTTLLPDVLGVAVGDVIRIDVIQVGSGTAGVTPVFTVTIRVPTVA